VRASSVGIGIIKIRPVFLTVGVGTVFVTIATVISLTVVRVKPKLIVRVKSVSPWVEVSLVGRC
jgi:hypothetical protein